MVDRGQHADDEEQASDLQRCLREARGDGGEPDTDEEDDHHAVPAPAIGDAPRRQREQAEGNEARHGVGHELGVGEPPLLAERKSGDRGEDEREQVIEEVPDVQIEEAQSIAAHGGAPRGSFLMVGSSPTLGRFTALYACPDLCVRPTIVADGPFDQGFRCPSLV